MPTPIRHSLLALAFALSSGEVLAQTTYSSAEPNETKAQATPADGLVDGDVLDLGYGASVVNFFRVSTAPAPVGIHRHEIYDGHVELYGSDAHLDAVEPGTTALLQAAQAYSSRVAWYGFGRAESVYVNLAPYDVSRGYGQALYTTDVVTPIDIGVTPSQQSRVYLSATLAGAAHEDTSLQVFDAAFRPIPNALADDSGTFQTSASMSHVLRPGRYYVAAAAGSLATALPMNGYVPWEFAALRPVTDDMGAVAADRSAVGGTLTVQGYAGGGPLPTTTVVLQEDYEVVWLTFEVPGGGLLASELSFCAGTDSGTACPCGSAPIGPLGGCPNSTGRGATAMLYEPIATGYYAPDFAVALYDLPPGAMALPFLGFTATVDDPVGAGRLCLDPGAVRLDVLQADAAGKAEAPLAAGTIDPYLFGTTYVLQAAYRDHAAPHGCRLNVTSGTAYRL